MGIKLENIRDGSVVELDREPQIDAFINSSDLNLNGAKQDHGWRLAPEVVARIEEMRTDGEVMGRISQERGIPIDDISTGQLVSEILRQENAQKVAEERAIAMDRTAETDYNRRVEEAIKPKAAAKKPAAKPKK